jgi:diacylglycerol kinase (ATP)
VTYSPTHAPRADRCLIIANPAAGAVTKTLVEDVAGRCARHVPTTTVMWTRYRGQATELVQARLTASAGDRMTVIVSIGGDGTTLEVAEGLVSSGCRRDRAAMFVMPAGTGNSNYRAHWGTSAWQPSLDQALADVAASRRLLDMARIAELDELVLLGAGAGLSAEVLVTAREIQLAGKARLQAAVTRTARDYMPYACRVIVDGIVRHADDTVLVNVGGGRYRAWQYKLLPDSVLDDGLLDVCVVGSKIEPAAVPGLLRDGRHIGEPGVVYARGRQVVIERLDGRPLCFEHDGDVVATTGPVFTLDVVPGVLPVLCAPQAPVEIGGVR